MNKDYPESFKPYIIVTYKAGKLEIRPATLEEIEAERPDDYDLLIDCPHARTAVRSKDGKLTVYEGNIKGIGPIKMSLLKKLILAKPGRAMRPYEIGSFGAQIDSHYVKACLIPYVSCLRKRLFGETDQHPRFLLTRTGPYTITLNGKLNYCLIDWSKELREREED